jgi:hypothetical protein
MSKWNEEAKVKEGTELCHTYGAFYIHCLGKLDA